MSSREHSIRGLWLVAVLAIAGSGVDPLQSLYRKNRDGLAALEAGDAEEAVRLFTEAQALAPEDPRLLFNLGNALRAAERLDEAARAYSRASESGEGEVARDARFNRGVLELERDDAPAAVEGFGGALMIDPQDEEARRNLELALRRLPPPQPSRSAPKSGEDGDRQEGEKPPPAQLESSNDPASGDDSGESESDERQDSRKAPPEGDPQRSEQGNEQTETERDDGDEQPGESQRPSGDSGAEGSGDEPRGADAEMAERVLKALAKAERDALRRALGRRIDAEVPQSAAEKDW